MALSALRFTKIEDSDLGMVNGGMGTDDTKKSVYCPNCGELIKLTSDKKTVKCPQCEKIITL